MSHCIGEYDLGILFILLLVNGFDVSIDSVIQDTLSSIVLHCFLFHLMISQYRSNIRKNPDLFYVLPPCSETRRTQPTWAQDYPLVDSILMQVHE
jgi:hypothetical protein